MRKKIIQAVVMAGFLFLLSSCGFNAKTPGRVYMPDMTYSNALETYSPSDIPNEDGQKMSARRPVKNTIPRGWIPTDERIRTNEAYLASYMAKDYFIHDAAHWDEEYARAASTIKDPLEYTDANNAEGKRLYSIHCINCHGQAGNGQGNLVVLDNGSDGPYPAVPPDYKARLPQIKDGNIFYSVSYGKGMMGAYGYSLSVTERWQIIHYIKSIAGIKGDDLGTGAQAKGGKVSPDSTATVQQR
jgi:mono/diheme cytochrome c family protein